MCITWTPIPVLTWLCPLIGHTGIGAANGKIHDFAGPYTVGVDKFAFGETHKYKHLTIENPARWDEAIELADEHYKKRMHVLFWNNCHSHVASVLNKY